jgi:hypothetical protein
MDDFENLNKYYGPSTATPISPVPVEKEFDNLNKYYPNNQSANPQLTGANQPPGYEDEVSFYVNPESARKQEMLDTAKDVGASAVTRFPIGAVAGSVGAPGSLEQAGQVIPSFAAQKATDFLVGQNFITPETQEKVMSAANQPSVFDYAAQGKQALLDKYIPSVGTALREGQEAGYVSRSGLPTSEGVEAAMKKVMPFLDYKPKTTKGEYAGKAADFAGQFSVGPVKGIAGRLTTGIATGLGAKAGEKFAEDQGVNPATGELLGTISGLFGGSVLTAGSRYLPFRNMPAKKDLAKSLDPYGGQASVSAQRLAEGAPLNRDAEMIYPRIQEFFSNFSPNKKPINSALLQDVIEAEGRQRTTGLYRLSSSNPNAASIPSNLFVPLQKYPAFREAMQNAEEAAIKNPDFNIKPPIASQSTPISGPNNQTLLNASGNPVMRQTPAVDGNLEYWDQVHKELGRIIKREQAVPGKDDATLVAATNSKKQLDRILDKRVPTYRDARGSHIEMLGGIDAVDAGENFLKNLPTRELRDIKVAVSKMNPEQMDAFRVGVLQNIQNEVGNGRIGNVVSQMTLKPEYRERLEAALGPEVFSQIRGKVLAENLIAQASNLQLSMAKKSGRNISDLTGYGLVGAAAGAGSELLSAANQILMQTMGLPQGAGMKAAVGLAAGMGVRGAYNVGERAIAEKMLPLIKSNNPEDFAKLSKLMDSKDARLAYDKLLRTTVAISRQNENKDQAAEPPRADGGRVGRANGGKVGVDVEADALIRAAERSKKDFNRTTEPLLNTPDNHIAKALEVANRAI